MSYCDVCDSILQPKEINGKIVPFCEDCGEEKGSGSLATLTFETDKNTDPEGGKILILEEDDNSVVGRSKKEMFCENCKGSQQVEFWELQTRSADESATRFFRCTKCNKNWREYD